MEQVLIVSGSNQGAKSLSDIVNSNSRSAFTVTNNSGEARRLINSKSFDLVIINSPLSDTIGSELAIHSATQTMAGIIFIVKSDIYGMISAKLEDYGIMVIEKPLDRNLFMQALRLSHATLNRIKGFKQENVRLKNQINEMRLTDRAKAILIEYLKLTEPQAHRFIVKQAMDMRMTKTEVAQNILKTYSK